MVFAPLRGIVEELQNDLEVTRLLVETGSCEVIDPGLLLVILTRFYVQYLPNISPVLEYLCKQEFFDFSINDIVAFSGRRRFALCSSFLRIFLACAGNVVIPMFTDGTSLITHILRWRFVVIYTDPEKQKKDFNSTVIMLSLCLKYGFHPSTLLCNEPCAQADHLADADPDFAAVAWQLALQMNGWVFHRNESLQEGCNGWTGEDEPFQRKLEEGEELVSDPASGSKDSAEHQKVPGAWTNEETDEVASWKFPIVREFCSISEDFISVTEGKWLDPNIYLRPGSPYIDRLIKNRDKSIPSEPVDLWPGGCYADFQETPLLRSDKQRGKSTPVI